MDWIDFVSWLFVLLGLAAVAVFIAGIISPSASDAEIRAFMESILPKRKPPA